MIGALILAAGESGRMGQDKALLTYRGRTFLETIIDRLREAGIERITVVLGYHAEQVQAAVKLKEVHVVINPDYRRGQTSSLQAGLQASATAGLEAVVLCLVDHPLVKAGTVQKLVARFRDSGCPVVIPTFQGKRGHPVLIGRALFDELLRLDPGRGADGVIRAHRAQTQFVAVDDEGILVDVDDPQTYSRLESHAG